MLDGIKRIAKLAKLKKVFRAKLESIAEIQSQLAQKATVTVFKEVFSGVELPIGEHTMKLEKDETSKRFRLVEEDEKTRIEMMPL